MEHFTDLEKFISIIDNSYDCIEVWDHEYRLLYVNKSCYRILGLYPEQLIGKKLDELMGEEKYWTPSTLPYVYNNKKSIMQKQKTLLGTEILTIASPVFDEDGEVKYVVMTERDSYEILSTRLSAIEQKENVDVDSERTGIIYSSIAMKNVMKTAQKVAENAVNCLILGETGTGKSLLAKFIHKNSTRSDEKFVVLNMASMNPTMIEAELFGYAKGAFTGASTSGKKGLFELANHGTLFLDEIGELPLSLQAKFLHALQEKEYMPVGAIAPIKVDVRVISATNCNLEELVKVGSFREDLYHRLNTIEIVIPPVRERKKDLDILLSYYLNLYNVKYKKNCYFSEIAKKELLNYRFQGNVREVSNIVERCVLLAEQDEITPEELPKHIYKLTSFQSKSDDLDDITDLHEELSRYEKKIVMHHYQKNGSTRKLAKALGISQTTAKRMIDKYIEK